jgi:hypothetical protein
MANCRNNPPRDIRTAILAPSFLLGIKTPILRFKTPRVAEPVTAGAIHQGQPRTTRMSTLANKASLISSWARGPFPNARYHWSTHSRFSRSAFGPTGSSGKFQFLRANSRLLFSKKSSRATPVSGSLLSGWPPSSPLTCIGYQIANSSLRKEARFAKASAELRVSQCTP